GPDTALPEGAIPGAATLREATASQQAQYLTHFRADAIVADAELMREHLGAASWSPLGQSFGGFTTLRYLSAAAGSVDTALFTGGLPAVGPGMDDVYATTWQGMIGRSERYWARFPADRDRFRRLADAADAGRLRLPDGQRVGVERRRRLGGLLGAAHGAERPHHRVDVPRARRPGLRPRSRRRAALRRPQSAVRGDPRELLGRRGRHPLGRRPHHARRRARGPDAAGRGAHPPRSVRRGPGAGGLGRGGGP